MLDLGCYVSLLMCTWVRMGQKLASMCKNNYCRGLTKGFYHCAIIFSCLCRYCITLFWSFLAPQGGPLGGSRPILTLIFQLSQSRRLVWNKKKFKILDGEASAQATEVTLLSTLKCPKKHLVTLNFHFFVSQYRYLGGVPTCKILASYLN
jgi:hypothetical protein